MFKISMAAAAAVVLTTALASSAYAYSFRPGSDPSGGRVGKVCNTQLLSAPEQADCINRMRAAKTSAERREITDTIRTTLKERQKEVDKENERLNPGGKNGLACSGTQCQ